jgi:hypothetical protein
VSQDRISVGEVLPVRDDRAGTEIRQ